jgi:hypothetical protein
MLLRTFFMGMGMALTLCVACSRIQGPGTITTGARTLFTCDRAFFLGKLQYLATPYIYQPGGTPPAGVSPHPTYNDGLGDAFDAASSEFQQQLCSLDAIYVNETSGASCQTFSECSGYSWGWRQRSPTVGSGRLIALATSLWTSSHPTRPYSSYETDLFQSVLPRPGSYYGNALNCNPVGSSNCTSIDTLKTTLLAALAHEVGHVRWYDPSAPGGSNLGTDCIGKEVGKSWRTVTPPPRWRDLLTLAARQKNPPPDEHQSPPAISDIDTHIGDPDYAAGKIQQLFVPGASWASALATMAPDEDFVESYKFKVLTTAKTLLNYADIFIAARNFPYKRNVAGDYAAGRKARLADKLACIPL